MKTICFVMMHAFPVMKGGAELQAYNLAKYFVKRGYDVHYIYQSRNKIKEENSGIKWHKLPFLPNNFSLNILNYPKLVKSLKIIDPDIIYQRAKNIYTGQIGFYSHEKDSIFVWGASSEKDCLPQKEPNIKRKILRGSNLSIGNYGIKKADAIVVQTKTQQNLLIKNYGLESIIIPNGHPIPVGQFKKEYPPIIVWVANIKKIKQPELFIKLARDLKDQKSSFIMIGKPEVSDYGRKIEEMISATPNLQYLGEVSNDEVKKIIAKSSILVNTSVREGLPNTYIEAWMRETPVVTINCDPDGIIGDKGLGVKTGDYDKLVKTVRDLLHNHNLIEKMGRQARKHSVEAYDINKNFKRYETLFKSIK